VPCWWDLVYSLTALQIHQLTAPRYACPAQNPPFFGCCTIYPCNGDNTGCPSDFLKAAGMGTGSGPNATTNDGSYWPNVFCANGKWWTCDTTMPTFQGCCISNPCNATPLGCPMGNLFPAALGTVSSAAPTPTSTTPASSSVESTITTSTSTTSTSAVQSTASTTSASGNLAATSTSLAPLHIISTLPGPNIAAITGGAAGGAIGGVLLLLVIAFGIWRCRQRRKSILDSDPNNPQLGPKGPNTPYSDGKHKHPLLNELSDSVNNVEGSSPGQAMYGGKSNNSPGPPAYQSPRRSPRRNTHEIDSTELHEIEGQQTPGFQSVNSDGRMEGGAAQGLGLDYVAELPSNSRSFRRSR
jgi:hypothetical protein